jgi:hypothetical protein
MQIWLNYQADKLIDFLLNLLYGLNVPAYFCGFFAFRSETTWLREIQNDVNGPK